MRLLIITFALSEILGHSPKLFEGELAWDVYFLSNNLQLLVWQVYLFHTLPYRQLACKSCVFALCTFQTFDSLLYMFWRHFAGFHFEIRALQTIITVWVVSWFYHRQYSRGSDELDEDNFFQVGIIPNGFQDFLLSLFFDPVGGVGIYCNGKFYHYHRGIMKVRSKDYLKRASKKYRITKVRSIDKRRLGVLESLPTSKYKVWSLVNNCQTVLAPILGKRGKPYF